MKFNSPIIDELYERKKVHDLNGKEYNLGGNVSKEEALRLFHTIRTLEAKVTLETGLAYGASAIAIMEGLKNNGGGTHHVIDPYQEAYHNIGTNMPKKLGLSEYFKFYHKFPEEVIPQLDANIDFAFIDSSHVFDLTVMEFVLIDKKLKVGGVIGFHDLWMPALQKFLSHVLNNRKYKLYPQKIELPPQSWKHWLSLLIKKLPYSNKLFAQEILHPFSQTGLPNLVMIQKMEDDKRHWQYYKTF
jgi:predicted O-methyltransferase YrrM